MKLKDILDRLVKAQGDGDFIENTNAEMQTLLGVSHNTCDKYMRELAELGLITRTTCRGKVVRTRVGAGAMSAPLSIREAMIAGRLDLALSMVLSGLVYHEEAPPGEIAGWKKARPEWLVYTPRFKELLKRYDYDRMDRAMFEALWYDVCEDGPNFRDANVYVGGIRDGEILAPELLIENIYRNMGKFIASMDADAAEAAKYARLHYEIGHFDGKSIYQCLLPCCEGHPQAMPEQLRMEARWTWLNPVPPTNAPAAELLRNWPGARQIMDESDSLY
jgi:hypothetical protein